MHPNFLPFNLRLAPFVLELKIDGKTWFISKNKKNVYLSLNNLFIMHVHILPFHYSKHTAK